MTDSICEILQTSTSLLHSNSINSNSTNNNKTAPTSYITELLYLYKHGIYHTPNGDCLPSCITYKSHSLRHPYGSHEFLEDKISGIPFPMHPETGTKDARKCSDKDPKDTYPKKIILQRKKQNNFLKKVGDFLITI